MKWIFTLFLIAAVLACGFAFAQEAAGGKPVVILYTNDVHCGIESGVGYAGLAAYEKAYAAEGYEVLLVDNGDAIQGGPIGTLSEGEYIIDIMNEIGYDIATIGNHEFDYGFDQLMDIVEMAEFPYICANFADARGELVFDAHAIMEVGGWKIGFVGALTPMTINSANPKYFQDAEGNYIYSFSAENDGAELYTAIQSSVDAVRAEGAQIVILMSHLGIEDECRPYTSYEVIANTTGIDVVLDGHSGVVIEGEPILNANGEEVILTSAGTHLAYVGSLTIEAGEDGAVMTTKLHDESLFQDAEFSDYIQTVKARYEESLNQVVGAAEVDLVISDPAILNELGEPVRLVRNRETNLGNLCADAYRDLLGADIGFVNGGGVVTGIPEGEITFGQILKVHPYGNMACMIEIEGRHILDALELGCFILPREFGGFLQTSGLTYEVDTSIESSVVLDEQDSFVEVAGDRRVSNVRVNGDPIDPDKLYTVASHNFMLKDGGDGYSMFKKGTVIVDEVMLDNQMLATYISDVLGGVVGEDYAVQFGQDRIVIK